jgi:hypothetical protein
VTCNDLIDDDEYALSKGELPDEATILLRGWFPLVRILPSLILQEDRSDATWGLVVWYERVFEDAEYASGPPIEGLDALIDELAHFVVASDVHLSLARARWAIRVAEELVRWRSCADRTGDDPVRVSRARDRLELAMEGARRQLSAP